MKKFMSILCSAVLLVCGVVSPVTVSAEETAPTEPTTSAPELLFPHYTDFSPGDVPKVYVDTKNDNIFTLSKVKGYTETNIAIINTNGTIIKDSGLIKVRGNSTAMSEKKSYTIKFDSKHNVLGMGKAKKWWLIANGLDPTLMRNELVLGLSRNLEMPYVSSCQYAEVWLDGKFRGCYQIIEPLDTGKSRIDIQTKGDKPETEFLIQYERTRDDPAASYCTADGLRFEIKEPDQPTKEQIEYITQTTENVIKTVKTLNFREIEKVIDIDSFAKYYIVNEFTKNVDCNYTSIFYFFKNGKLYAGPPWDYDLTAGNVNPEAFEAYRQCSETEGLYANNALLFKYLCQCRDFNNAVRRNYEKYFPYFENIYADDGEIAAITERYSATFERNFTEAGWDASKVYNNLTKVPEKTYEENVEYLRCWLRDRNEWLIDYYDIFGDPWYTVGDVNGDSVISTADAVSLLNYLVSKYEFSDVELLASDLDSDGKVNVYDMVLMRKLILKETK